MTVGGNVSAALRVREAYNAPYVWAVSLVAALGGLLFGYDSAGDAGPDSRADRAGACGPTPLVWKERAYSGDTHKMAVLITGGAGYIGSVFVELMQRENERVVVLDNLGRGHRAAVDPGVPFCEGSVGDRGLVMRLVREHQVDACVHFAALAYVGESVENPARYYANNVGEGLALLGALLDAGVRRF
ncbi:MAG: NAD-dependent epimerase/dehydratase family protein, partial [Phycisphaerae bacterium]